MIRSVDRLQNNLVAAEACRPATGVAALPVASAGAIETSSVAPDTFAIETQKEHRFILRDGREVNVRPVCASDRGELIDFYTKGLDDSSYRDRFMGQRGADPRQVVTKYVDKYTSLGCPEGAWDYVVTVDEARDGTKFDKPRIVGAVGFAEDELDEGIKEDGTPTLDVHIAFAGKDSDGNETPGSVRGQHLARPVLDMIFRLGEKHPDNNLVVVHTWSSAINNMMQSFDGHDIRRIGLRGGVSVYKVLPHILPTVE